METLISILHYLVCIFLIIVILLQAGKGADIGAAFGGSSQTVFGSRGAATFLSKLTTGIAIVFLITSISLAIFSKNKTKSTILKDLKNNTQVLNPAGTPAPSATPVPAQSPAPSATPTATPVATPS